MFLPFLGVAVLWQSVLADSNRCKLALSFLDVEITSCSPLTVVGSSSVTITSQSDADSLSNCDTVVGSVVIGSSASGTITIDNVEEIKGSLTAGGVIALTELVTRDLDTIQGSLSLKNLDSLTALTMNLLFGHNHFEKSESGDTPS